jgi:hypothetical protein
VLTLNQWQVGGYAIKNLGLLICFPLPSVGASGKVRNSLCFQGGHLDMNENDMATGGSDVEMLEGAGSDELDGWL